MCGIACVAGGKGSAIECYKALSKLEYRGYDSAGMAYLTKDEICLKKQTGMVAGIEKFAKNCKAGLVISHTRWATHGKPTEENAHPHLSYSKELAIVHNGIIENFMQIKSNLEKEGIKFKSQTDSECIANLIASKKGKIIEKVRASIKQLVGSYAIAILDKKSKRIVATRKISPLFISKTKKGVMVASDIICFNGIASSYYSLKEGEIAVVSSRGFKLFDENGKQIKPCYSKLTQTEEEVSKQGYQYFMEKEICEIPAVIKRIQMQYKNKEVLKSALKLFDGVKNVVLVGCGTAYHASMYGASVLQKVLGVPCEAKIASELKYSNIIIDNTLAIFVSQSGETADTLGCATLFKERQAKTLAITNVMHSGLAKMCDAVLPVFAGAEIAVASTKAYVAQILVLYLLARCLENSDYDFKDLENLADDAKNLINIDEEILELVKNATRVFFVGRGLDSITALESALKLKEISYKSAEGYPAGELKHGTIALIDEGSPVFVIATNKDMLDKTLNSGQEVKARGAKVIVVTFKSASVSGFDYKIDLPDAYSSELLSIISVIPFQLLAFKASVLLGNNPDKPRNLAKSVTVE